MTTRTFSAAMATATAGCLLAAAPATHAEDSGWYAGAGLGQSRINLNEGPFMRSSDDWADSWSLTAGYRFNSWFALEAGYTSLGTLRFHSDTSSPGVFDVNTKLTLSGFNAALVGIVPLGSAFDVHGRLGVLFSDTDLDIVFPDDGFQQSGSGNDRDLFIGAGVAWHVNDNWSLSLDYQRYDNIGPDHRFPSSDADMDSVGLSAFFKF